MIAILAKSFFVCILQFNEPNSGGSTDRFVSNQQVQGFAELVDAHPLWSTPCQKTNSSPVIAGDKVFLLERLNREQERVRCFQLGDGQTLWEHIYDAPLPIFFDDEYGWGPHSTPTIHQNKVITVGVSGIVWAIDIESGKRLWSRELWNEYRATELERGIGATPIIESGQVILPLGGVGSGIISISVDSGKTLWTSTDFKAAYTSPTVGEIDGQRQVVALMHDMLCSVAPATGELLWAVPFQVTNTVHVTSPLIIDQQYVLAGSSSGGSRLLKVAKEQGRWQVQEVWQTNRCSPQVGNFLQLKDQVIAPASGGPGSFTVCLNLKDGSVAWKERFGGRRSLIQLRDGLLTLNEKGDLEIRQVQPSKSQPVFQFRDFASAPQWSSPAIGDDVMVIQSAKTLQAWRLGRSR